MRMFLIFSKVYASASLLNDLIMKGLHGFSTLMCVDRACVNTIT